MAIPGLKFREGCSIGGCKIRSFVAEERQAHQAGEVKERKRHGDPKGHGKGRRRTPVTKRMATVAVLLRILRAYWFCLLINHE
jgi:hypothetical protein